MVEDFQDSLKFVPMEEWGNLERALKEDWPYGIPAYNLLLTQRKIKEDGLDYGFKVYCPHGDIKNGMVALNKKAALSEIFIYCPKDDTAQIEQALKTTKAINWSAPLLLPYLCERMLPCIRSVAENHGMCYESVDSWYTYLMIFSKDNPSFENVSLPEGVKLQPVLEKDLDMIDFLWSVRYYTSKWALNLHIKRKTSYSLYKDDEILTWVFINEFGALTHVYTSGKYRNRGYAKLLLKLVCNSRLKENLDVILPVKRGNDTAIKLYLNMGFKKLHALEWFFLYQ